MVECVNNNWWCRITGFATNPPKWDPTYSVRGTLNIPYSEITEPFDAWYDKPTGRSRIDYYGGMVKTYQLSRENSNGVSYKVAPVTTQTMLNKDTCLNVNGTAENKILVQSILPDTTGFKLIGEFFSFGVHKFAFLLFL